MEGMVRAARREADLAIVTAWHTARFALNGYADKGRLAGRHTLSDLLSSAQAEPRSKAAEAIAFFHAMKQRGYQVEITRH